LIKTHAQALVGAMEGLKITQTVSSEMNAPFMSLNLTGKRERSEPEPIIFWEQLKNDETIHAGYTFNPNEIFGTKIDQGSHNAENMTSEFGTTTCASSPFKVSSGPKRRDLKRTIYDSPIKPVEASRMESVRSNLKNECPRCIRNLEKIVAKNEFQQNDRAHCDVGFKSIYRSVRRICIEELTSLKKIYPARELRQQLEAMIATQCWDTENPTEISDIATLMMAFDASKHRPNIGSYTGLSPASVRIFKLVQNVCYAWNWAVHEEILRSQPFKTLLNLPFMSQFHVID